MSESDNQEALLPNKFQFRSISSKRFEDAFTEYRESSNNARCRPLAFLLALPFALIGLALSLVGAVIWILGAALTYICPCLFCIPVIVQLALTLILAPFAILTFVMASIPC